MERGPTRDVGSFLSQSIVQPRLSNPVPSLDLALLVYPMAVAGEGGEVIQSEMTGPSLISPNFEYTLTVCWERQGHKDSQVFKSSEKTCSGYL